MITSHEFLVSHGCAASLSRCRASCSVQRGDSVVIRSARGLELGEVLCEAFPDLPAISPGELLRVATRDDRLRVVEMNSLGIQLLDQAQHCLDAEPLPLLPLDAEVLLDRSQALLHVLRWEACTITPLIEKLQSQFDIRVVLVDRSKPEEHGHGCGSCGEGGCGSCGEGGCSTGGCSSGSCSRGSIKSAEELTRSFSELRKQMEAMQRVPLL